MLTSRTVKPSPNAPTESNKRLVAENDTPPRKRPDMQGAEQRGAEHNALHEVRHILAVHHERFEALSKARKEKIMCEASLRVCQQKVLETELSLANLQRETKLLQRSLEEATSKVASLEAEQLPNQKLHERLLTILKEEPTVDSESPSIAPK